MIRFHPIVEMPVPGHTPFAIWYRSGNRLIELLLRSPLHSLASGRLTLITVTGRRTGREHTFPVAYEEQGERLTIPVVWPRRKVWWRNLLDGAPVRVRLRGTVRTGEGRAKLAEDGSVSVEVRLAD